MRLDTHKQTLRLSGALALVLVLVFVGLAVAGAGPEGKAPFPYIKGKAYPILAGTHNHESGYESICQGHDGHIYIGTAKYGVNCYLVDFDPKTEVQKIAVDAHKAIGQTATGYAAQAKIHTRNFVAPSGVIYMGTKQGYVSREERETADVPIYGGGHVLTYDPKTGVIEDLGKPWPGYGVIEVAADEKRGLVYAVMCEDPYAWMLYDRATKRWRYLGVDLATNSNVLIDRQGRATALRTDFQLVRYNPGTGKTTAQPIMLDGQKLTRTRAELHTIPSMVIDPEGKCAYLTILNKAEIFRIDLDGPETGNVTATTLGTLVNGSKPDSRCCLTIAPDGRVYAMVSVLNETGFGAPNRRLHHLARYDPKTKKCEDLGVLAIQNPDFFEFTLPDGKPRPLTHGYQKLPDGTLTVLHNTMSLTAASDGSLYATILYPFTLLRIQAADIP